MNKINILFFMLISLSLISVQAHTGIWLMSGENCEAEVEIFQDDTTLIIDSRTYKCGDLKVTLPKMVYTIKNGGVFFNGERLGGANDGILKFSNFYNSDSEIGVYTVFYSGRFTESYRDSNFSFTSGHLKAVLK